MRFQLTLQTTRPNTTIAVNYQHLFSAVVYRILGKGNPSYAEFLHEEGYGKGLKFFTFSDLKGKFKVINDRMRILSPEIQFIICFHWPEATQTFIQGLFKSEEIVIADKKSRGTFRVSSIVGIPDGLPPDADSNEVLQVLARPLSPLVTGPKNDDGNYVYLSPKDDRFVDSLLYSWRSKIEAVYGKTTADNAVLIADVEFFEQEPRRRLIHIFKNGHDIMVRGWYHYKLRLTGEKRFLELIVNGGLGVNTAQGMGCIEIIESNH